ncbi:MAG TPA: glucose-1-phosphate adenylyltransferase [Candidatus Binatia bacterium]|jgi:glucose-1-phosphate adenylyltransferase|nr:glucose-1-phosphate adenylyltransferase [Candidatus Binatia bacterium]
MRQPRILGMILAGGRGDRLFPLTKARSKPAVPFAGKHRIIDFVLSNFINSAIYAVYVLVQYKSQSLIEHLRSTWGWRIGGGLTGTFITVVPPQQRWGESWYEGTADAVYQNLNLIRDFRPTLVAVFGADHIYRMDLNQMVAFHLESNAEITVAALPVPIAEASSFGVIEVDTSQRIVGFEEKPKNPKAMPNDPARAYSSMGNYLFNVELLMESLLEDSRRSTEHDFGRTIIPELFPRQRVFAYNFLQNDIPGVKPYEEKGYWRDVGTLRAYWEAHMDLLGSAPAFDLQNNQWPIFGSVHDGPPARFVDGEVRDSLIGDGCRIEGGRVVRSVLGRGVRISQGAEIVESVIMDYAEIGAGVKLRDVIVDRFNVIPAGSKIGAGADGEEQRFFRDPSGLIVLERGETR